MRRIQINTGHKGDELNAILSTLKENFKLCSRKDATIAVCIKYVDGDNKRRQQTYYII